MPWCRAAHALIAGCALGCTWTHPHTATEVQRVAEGSCTYHTVILDAVVGVAGPLLLGAAELGPGQPVPPTWRAAPYPHRPWLDGSVVDAFAQGTWPARFEVVDPSCTTEGMVDAAQEVCVRSVSVSMGGAADTGGFDREVRVRHDLELVYHEAFASWEIATQVRVVASWFPGEREVYLGEPDDYEPGPARVERLMQLSTDFTPADPTSSPDGTPDSFWGRNSANKVCSR